MNPDLGQYGEFLMMPAALVIIAFVFLMALVVVGYAMKWSVNLVDAGPIGFFYGLLISIVASVAGGAVSLGIALASGTQNQWILMAYSMAAGVATISAMAQCNPFKGFLAYLCNMVFSTMMMIGVCIAGALLLFVVGAVGGMKLPTNTPAMMKTSPSNWGTESGWTSPSTLPPPEDTRYITGGGGALQSNPFSE